MKSKITDKYQITIPKQIRERLKLTKHDVIEWKFQKGLVVVEPVRTPFFGFKGSIRVGSGDIKEDINKARRIIAEENK